MILQEEGDKETGTRNSVSIAASSVQSVPRPPEDTAWFIATGTVRVSGPVRRRAKRNSFQVRMRPKTKVAAKPATTCGRQIFKKTLASDDPSMRAASSTSGESSSKKLFIIQMVKARLKAV